MVSDEHADLIVVSRYEIHARLGVFESEADRRLIVSDFNPPPDAGLGVRRHVAFDLRSVEDRQPLVQRTFHLGHSSTVALESLRAHAPRSAHLAPRRSALMIRRATDRP